uniref:Uncharacterized protein n=1 Tax=Oryza glumipatula TaxID=40148 RepID=A0A0E0B271_9ORYZ
MAEEGELLAGGEPVRALRLEDAGLEDCGLPQESIAEAFSLATMAVSSRLAHFSLFDDDDDEEDDHLFPPRGGGAGGCVEDSGPTCRVIPDALVGVGGDRRSGADEVVVVGGGGGEGGDEVVIGGRGDEEDRVVVVGEERGEKLGSDNGCIEGIREGIADSDHTEGNGEEGKEVVVGVEKAILVEDFT